MPSFLKSKSKLKFALAAFLGLTLFNNVSQASVDVCGYVVDDALYNASYMASASYKYSVNSVLLNAAYATPGKEIFVACNIVGPNKKEYLATLLVERNTNKPTVIRFGHY